MVVVFEGIRCWVKLLTKNTHPCFILGTISSVCFARSRFFFSVVTLAFPTEDGSTWFVLIVRAAISFRPGVVALIIPRLFSTAHSHPRCPLCKHPSYFWTPSSPLTLFTVGSRLPFSTKEFRYIRHILTPLPKQPIRRRQTRMLFWRINNIR